MSSPTFGNTNPPLGNTCSALKTDNRSSTSGGGLPPQRASPEAVMPDPSASLGEGQGLGVDWLDEDIVGFEQDEG